MGSRRGSPWPAWALLGVVACYVAAATPFVRGWQPNQDEGWYLYAAKLVAAGQRPYVDFAYVQPPLLPHLYAALGVWESVEAGRRANVLLGGLTVLLLGLLGHRRGGGALAAAVFGLSAFVLAGQTVVKAYAAANLWLAAGLLLALMARGRAAPLALAAVAFALAGLCRNSVASALPVYWLWLAGRRETRRALLWAVPAGLLPWLWLLGPLLAADAAAVRFHLLEHHAANAARDDLLTVAVKMLVIGKLVAGACPVLVGFTTVGLLGLLLDRPARAEVRQWPEIGLTLLLAVVLFAGHFVSGHPYQEYQVVTLPAVAALCALCWEELLGRLGRNYLVATALLLLGGFLPAWLVATQIPRLPGHRPGPDGVVDPAGVFGPLERVGALVAEHCPPDQPVFTFQTDVALAARRELSPGLTLASFSFSGRADAERWQMVNAASITRTLAAREPAVVVLSPGDLANLLHGELTPEGRVVVQPLDETMTAVYGPLIAALDEGYALVGSIDRVGQFAETFHVFARRAP